MYGYAVFMECYLDLPNLVPLLLVNSYRLFTRGKVCSEICQENLLLYILVSFVKAW